jgi:hypothetical protein
MIGIGIPSSQSSAPLPKLISASCRYPDLANVRSSAEFPKEKPRRGADPRRGSQCFELVNRSA